MICSHPSVILALARRPRPDAMGDFRFYWTAGRGPLRRPCTASTGDSCIDPAISSPLASNRIGQTCHLSGLSLFGSDQHGAPPIFPATAPRFLASLVAPLLLRAFRRRQNAALPRRLLTRRRCGSRTGLWRSEKKLNHDKNPTVVDGNGGRWLAVGPSGTDCRQRPSLATTGRERALFICLVCLSSARRVLI